MIDESSQTDTPRWPSDAEHREAEIRYLRHSVEVLWAILAQVAGSGDMASLREALASWATEIDRICTEEKETRW